MVEVLLELGRDVHGRRSRVLCVSPPQATIMSTIADAFLDHLVLTFSKLETNEYDLLDNLNYTGPTDWRTDAISRSLETIRQRCVADSDPVKVSPSSVPFSEDEVELDDEWVIVSKNEVAEMETMLSPSNANSLPIIDDSRSQQTPASLPPPESIRADAVRCSENIPLVMPPFFSPFPPTPDTVQELRLLKAQVSDFVRVCNAVSRGDFTQKLYGWADSTVMEQFRVTVNGMVDRVASFSNEIRSNDLRHTLSNDYSCLSHPLH
ncbi:hypothetical protein SCHPADRAFT_4586 [Schizopora paradoxa]|uniref:HAMP domain-containing protein n=1 Tax=Schizopora paradoxa TaxID=27342 RepID=A0A0H2S7Y9_9AGAM|nr:hypothetical protein SCHPADRAFT_4586 [Schizopora paradoxa]